MNQQLESHPIIQEFYQAGDNAGEELTRSAFIVRDILMARNYNDLHFSINKIRHMIDQNKYSQLCFYANVFDIQDFYNCLNLEQLKYLGW